MSCETFDTWSMAHLVGVFTLPHVVANLNPNVCNDGKEHSHHPFCQFSCVPPTRTFRHGWMHEDTLVTHSAIFLAYIFVDVGSHLPHLFYLKKGHLHLISGDGDRKRKEIEKLVQNGCRPML